MIASMWVKASTVLVISGLVLMGCAMAEDKEPNPEMEPRMPASPVSERLLRCILDDGWDAERHWSGGVIVETPPNQDSQVQASLDRCSEESGWSAGMSALSHEQTVQLYGQEVEEFACLSELGLPAPEPPTLQVYLDTFMTGDQYYAISEVSGGSSYGGDFESVISQCPPPTWFLNLDGY